MRSRASTQVAHQLRDEIASMDLAHAARDDDSYRAASARAFRVVLAMTEASGFGEVVQRLNR
jgi:hypothetical protein